LKVNYPTPHQIREAADKLLPQSIRDVDGNAEDRTGTVSIFNGSHPEVRTFDDEKAEARSVAEWINACIADGIEPAAIGVFVRTNDQLTRPGMPCAWQTKPP